MASLEIVANGRRRTVPLDKSTFTIGRQPDNDIVIEDTKASRRHCTIEAGPDGLKLRDLNSRNGTWIGPNRIIEADLSDGSVFRIGETQFIISTGSSAPGKAAPQRMRIAPAAAPVPSLNDSGELVIPAPAETAESREPDAEIMPAMSGGGPLARQLAPILDACRYLGPKKNMPTSPREVRLLDRTGKPLVMKGAAGRPAEAIAALQQLLFASLRIRATDIHIEPKDQVFTLRLRIDGLMQAIGDMHRQMGLAMLNVIKILCHIDIAKRSVVQEGSFSAELADRRVDFRISFTPASGGQKLALRILDKSSVPATFEELGMDAQACGEVRRVCGLDSGMIIVSGPTGAGKTTTLYTALSTIDARRRNVITVEDPIEYHLEHTTQIAIDPTHNVTFASVLSTILRQDPDVLFVGEIRDKETATLAMQAAATGHLVLTSIHARDTIGTIFRLLDLGVEPYVIANAVSLIIAQRLVRVLCPHCKRPYRPDAKQIRDLRLEDRPTTGSLYDHVGCTRCMHTGYFGRMALFEVLRFTSALRDVVLTRPTISEIRKVAGDWMFQTLMDSGYRQVLAGLTTVEEVERVCSSD
ncbi:MAG: Flp pilus assembly complex ATPase component TadA [Phycisphaerae bacterium]|nr:Flp pilus assembly complex ATPase component TadA [Phycisphaerae bacterium]